MSIRIDDSWFRIDLVFFHRRLRCLFLADLKIGRFSYADAGYGKPDVMRRAA
jgi:predicted nuclease of restriction endonuclease-like (RecB) superfamily